MQKEMGEGGFCYRNLDRSVATTETCCSRVDDYHIPPGGHSVEDTLSCRMMCSPNHPDLTSCFNRIGGATHGCVSEACMSDSTCHSGCKMASRVYLSDNTNH